MSDEAYVLLVIDAALAGSQKAVTAHEFLGAGRKENASNVCAHALQGLGLSHLESFEMGQTQGITTAATDGRKELNPKP